MAQPHPEERMTLDQVLSLVDKLEPAELDKLREKLDLKSWAQEWDRLQSEIEKNQAARNLKPLTEKEIFEEFSDYRRERNKRAHSSD